MTNSERRAWAELLLPMVLGVLIAGTGGWTEGRWTLGLAVMGYGPAMRMKWNEGYWTRNPQFDLARAAEAARLNHVSTDSDEETQARQADGQASP